MEEDAYRIQMLPTNVLKARLIIEPCRCLIMHINSNSVVRLVALTLYMCSYFLFQNKISAMNFFKENRILAIKIHDVRIQAS